MKSKKANIAKMGRHCVICGQKWDSPVVRDLELFRSHVVCAPGHAHLYGEFDGILVSVARFRAENRPLYASLASGILATVDLLLLENGVGRRPWTGRWETYFAKCMENAGRLLKEFASFTDYDAFIPAGYCNRFLDAFMHMDRHAREYEERYHPRWSQHFAGLASFAAQMFSLVADKKARIEEEFLEHPDDAVFTWLLTGYARSETSKAHELLHGYLKDKEAWVRQLAKELMDKYFDAQHGAPADADLGFPLRDCLSTPVDRRLGIL